MNLVMYLKKCWTTEITCDLTFIIFWSQSRHFHYHIFTKKNRIFQGGVVVRLPNFESDFHRLPSDTYQNDLWDTHNPLLHKFDKNNIHTIPTKLFFLGHFKKLKSSPFENFNAKNFLEAALEKRKTKLVDLFCNKDRF